MLFLIILICIFFSLLILILYDEIEELKDKNFELQVEIDYIKRNYKKKWFR